MNFKSSSTIILFFLIMSTLFLLISPGKAAPSSFETVRLSDVAQTNGGLQHHRTIILASNSVHVFWQEETGTNERTDLFYRKLPFGNTINLSDHILTEGDIGSWDAQLSNDGNVAVIWSEGTPAGNSDLFFWRSSDGQLLNLSSTASTTGNTSNYLYQLLLDSNGKAHVLWVEEPTMSPFVHDLFYWNENSGVTQILSPSGTMVGVGGAIVSRMVATLVNNVLHVSWVEYVGPTQIFDPFYWNSSSQSRVNLSYVADPSSSQSHLQMAITPTNEAHIFWLGDRCPFHWSSASQVTDILVANTADCSSEYIEVKQDSAGQVHTVWSNEVLSSNTGLYYWKVGSSTVNTISETIRGLFFGENTTNILFPTETQAHIIWDGMSDTQFEGDDVYYWDSINQSVQNLSNHALTSGSDGRISEMKPLIDSMDILHLYWLETVDDTTEYNDLFYWNSDEQLTRLVSDPAIVTGDARSPVAKLDSNNIPHVIWRENGAGMDELSLNYWNNSFSIPQALPIGNNSPSFIGYDLAIDPTNTVQIAWSVESGIIGEGANLYLWNGFNGSTDLSDIEKTEGHSGAPTIIYNDSNQMFIIWEEDEDLFAAFEPTELPYTIFLPITLKN